MPTRSWEYSDDDDVCGVDLRDGQIVYFSMPKGPQGRFGEVGSSQSVENFLAYGPSVAIPRNIVLEVLHELGNPSTTWLHPSAETATVQELASALRSGDVSRALRIVEAVTRLDVTDAD